MEARLMAWLITCAFNIDELNEQPTAVFCSCLGLVQVYTLQAVGQSVDTPFAIYLPGRSFSACCNYLDYSFN